MTRKLIALLMTLGVLSTPSVSATQAEDINSFTLDNGMKIMVLEDSSIPNANMYIFWKVGSRKDRKRAV